MELVESVILLNVPEGRGEFDEKILMGMGHGRRPQRRHRPDGRVRPDARNG